MSRGQSSSPTSSRRMWSFTSSRCGRSTNPRVSNSSTRIGKKSDGGADPRADDGRMRHTLTHTLVHTCTLGFPQLLRRERKQLGLTQAELAQRAGLSERAISDMERGLKVPYSTSMRALCDALGLSAEMTQHFDVARRMRRQLNEQPAAPISQIVL